MLSIAEQIAKIEPVRTGVAKMRIEVGEETTRRTFETLQRMGNVTAGMLADEMGVGLNTVRRQIRKLLSEEKVVGWRIGHQTWYSQARPPKRRKE